MKITALSLLLATSVCASPVLNKRQQVSSAIASATEAVSSAVASVTGGASSAIASATSSASSAAPSGSQDFATGLLAALRERQATTLATLLEPLAGTLGPVLSQGQWSLFAPGNEYLANVDTSDTARLTEILSYHLVAGDYPADALPVNTSVIAPTFLQAQYLGANNTQLPLAFAKDVFGTTNVIGQNISVIANSTYQNVLIKLINGVIIPPSTVPTVAAEVGASSLTTALASLLPDVVTALNTTQGLSLFAPNNAAVDAATPLLSSLAQSNPQAVSSAIQGHVIPSVVFSTNITDGLTVNSLAGTPLTFTSNATGIFVTGNGATAQVIAPDNIASNGVVHLIDGILFTPPASPSGSASASAAAGPVASASSAVQSVAGSATGAIASATGAVASATGAVASAISSVA